MGAGNEVKREPQREINTAAAAELGSTGLLRRGRSGRSWFDDAREARRQVTLIRETRADDRGHLRWCADVGSPTDDPRSSMLPRLPRKLAGVITPDVALGGLDHARQHGLLAADPEPELHEALVSLQDMVEAPDPPRRAQDRVNQGRALLKLEPIPHPLPVDG